MYYLKHIWFKKCYNPFIRLILDGFDKMGIRVHPIMLFWKVYSIEACRIWRKDLMNMTLFL